MLKRYVVNKGDIVSMVTSKTKELLRNERVAYEGAFLATLRETFLPHAQRGKLATLSEDEEDALLRKAYDDINELYTDEHWMIAQSDLLEQCYTQFEALHSLARNKALRYEVSNMKADKSGALVDPDKFPVYHRSPELISITQSLWEKEPRLLKNLRAQLGFILSVRPSEIDHHEAGDGVFVSTPLVSRKRGSEDGEGVRRQVLPGTLMGFFPGYICDPAVPTPESTREELHPFLRRFDGFWIDPEKELPLHRPRGQSYTELYENFIDMKELVCDQTLEFKQVEP